jgi:hypothetical protein
MSAFRSAANASAHTATTFTITVVALKTTATATITKRIGTKTMATSQATLESYASDLVVDAT